jgi:hypothetical protein
MTNCCDANGNCTQGRDCPIRKQRREATNRAYAEHGMVKDTDPYNDTLSTFKGLIAWLGLALGVWVVCLLLWGK